MNTESGIAHVGLGTAGEGEDAREDANTRYRRGRRGNTAGGAGGGYRLRHTAGRRAADC